MLKAEADVMFPAFRLKLINDPDLFAIGSNRRQMPDVRWMSLDCFCFCVCSASRSLKKLNKPSLWLPKPLTSARPLNQPSHWSLSLHMQTESTQGFIWTCCVIGRLKDVYGWGWCLECVPWKAASPNQPPIKDLRCCACSCLTCYDQSILCQSTVYLLIGV